MQDVYAAIHKGGLWLGPRFQAGCFTCTLNNISRGRHLCRSSIPGNGDGSGYATKRFCPEVCKQMQRMRTGPSGEGRRRAAVLSDVLLMVKTWTLNNSIPFEETRRRIPSRFRAVVSCQPLTEHLQEKHSMLPVTGVRTGIMFLLSASFLYEILSFTYMGGADHKAIRPNQI